MNESLNLKVVIVDDEELFRGGLADWLSTIEGVTVAGEAGNCEEALDVIKEKQPNVVLVDLLLPGVTGVEVVKRVRALGSDIKCIVISGAVSPEMVLDSFKEGACAFLSKTIAPEEMKSALKEIVKEDNWYISPSALKPVITKAIELRAVTTSKSYEGEDGSALDERERELLKMIAEGYTFQQISEQLECSSRSVERMKAKLQEKIGAESLVDMIRAAIKLNLISM